MLSKGSHSVRSPQVAISQLYTYANFEFYRKGTMNILKGGSVIQHFYGLSTDLDRINLAAYLCDLTCELTDEGVEARSMLRLLLNSLHCLATGRYTQEQIKGAFEIRAMALSGYMPSLGGCSACGARAAESYFLDVMNGSLLCQNCKSAYNNVPKSQIYAEDAREASILREISDAVLAAVRYCVSAPLEKLFAFELSDEGDRCAFSSLGETYALSHIGHGFDSLNFYHTMREMTSLAPKET
jgi:DNA repair protein RecO (recombination protein O)